MSCNSAIQIIIMNVENTQIQMKKGLLEFCVLLVIAKGEVYASEILETLKPANLIVVEGTLYPLLTRLKNNELLSYSWKESTSGPPRKYYRLTTKGKKFLAELKQTWEELNQAVHTIYAPTN